MQQQTGLLRQSTLVTCTDAEESLFLNNPPQSLPGAHSTTWAAGIRLLSHNKVMNQILSPRFSLLRSTLSVTTGMQLSFISYSSAIDYTNNCQIFTNNPEIVTDKIFQNNRDRNKDLRPTRLLLNLKYKGLSLFLSKIMNSHTVCNTVILTWNITAA